MIIIGIIALFVAGFAAGSWAVYEISYRVWRKDRLDYIKNIDLIEKKFNGLKDLYEQAVEEFQKARK